MPGATREHESEQRERAWSPPGEPGQVGERPSAPPDGGGDGEHHADDQQRAEQQRAEQQGQHGAAREDDDRDDQVPVVHRGVARVSSVAADCPPTSASAPGTACTGGAEPGDRVERRRGRSMRARTSSVTHGWVYVTQVGRQVRPPGSGRSPRLIRAGQLCCTGLSGDAGWQWIAVCWSGLAVSAGGSGTDAG